jgi:DNA-binding NtrC family response regulator
VPEDEDEAPGRGRGERILLLEDDACIRLTVDQLLRNQGYEVEVVANVADAIQRFTQDGGRFDVFFTDVVLPDGNGFEVATRFRTSRPGLAVLLSSGYTDDRARWGESKALGFRFIQKPYAARALLHTMRRLLDERTPPKA